METDIREWTEDWKYFLKGGKTSYSYRKPDKLYNNEKCDKSPVIFIPGTFQRWPFLKHIIDLVHAEGYPVHVFPELGSNWMSIPESAETVWNIILHKDIRDAVIVAHSKGGLIGKYLLAKMDKEERIKALIAVATPFFGAEMANMTDMPVYREMAPQSKLIKMLLRHKRVNKKIYSIIPVSDNFIPENDSNHLPGAHNLVVNASGHHKILFHPKTEKLILEILSSL